MSAAKPVNQQRRLLKPVANICQENCFLRVRRDLWQDPRAHHDTDMTREPTALQRKNFLPAEARQTILDHLDALPRCHSEDCHEIATHISLDAAGEMLDHCAEHARPGGFYGEDGPYEKDIAPTVFRLKKLL